MIGRTVKIGLIALLLAGFTATMAAAGESRRARGRVEETEEEDGRRTRRPQPSRTSEPTRREAPATRHDRHPGRDHVKVPPRRPPVVRHEDRRFTFLHPRHRSWRRHAKWVRGHYEVRITKVWIPGHFKRKKIPAVYGEFEGRFGRMIRHLIRGESHRKVWVKGHYRVREERVWISGRWVRMHGRR